MNPLDQNADGDVNGAVREGEFKRLVKYDATMGEVEKKHVLASASHILELAERSLVNMVDLPPLPDDLYVMTVVSPMHAASYAYIFSRYEDAESSARWYVAYARWGVDGKKDAVLETRDSDAFVLRLVNTRSGDFITITKSSLNFRSLVPS